MLHPDLGRMYHDKVGQPTAAFQDDALKVRAFKPPRALIEAVVLTPEDGDLTIDLGVSWHRCCRYVPELKRRKPPRG